MPEKSSLMDFLQAGALSAAGAIVGTAVKLVTHPPNRLGRWFVQSFVGISVGTFCGASMIEWFHLGPWVGVCCGMVAGRLSDEILRGIDANGRRIERLRPPLPFEDDQGEDYGA